jgi:hypothetical protein
MNGGDVVEYWLVKQPPAVRWSVSILAFAGVIVLMAAASATGPKGLLVGYLILLLLGLAISRLVRAADRSSALRRVGSDPNRRLSLIQDVLRRSHADFAAAPGMPESTRSTPPDSPQLRLRPAAGLLSMSRIQ